MNKTLWKKSSSFPSDRYRSSNSPPQSNKRKSKANDVPKSKELINLETLANNVQTSTGKDKDPKGGCFCQGALRGPRNNNRKTSLTSDIMNSFFQQEPMQSLPIFQYVETAVWSYVN